MRFMKSAVILAGGKGTRIWPYAQVRPKAMIPVANQPIIQYNVDALKDLGFDNIMIIGGEFSEQISNHFSNDGKVTVLNAANPKGAAFSVADASVYIKDNEFLALYGDTIISKNDLEILIDKHNSCNEPVTALVSPLTEERSNDYVCCNLKDENICKVVGHPRGGYNSGYYVFAAFIFNKTFMPYLKNNPGMFIGGSGNLQVGMMPPMEGFIEVSVADYINKGNLVTAVITKDTFIDIDKPWHILMANHVMVNKLCEQIEENQKCSDACSDSQIDPTASINGKVKLGKGSRIGKNVIIKGNVILGDNSAIENGAIISGNVIIGKNTYIGNYCYIDGNTTIGNRCVVSHCAELSGMIMDGVYLYHYMEISGIVGVNTDIGAATVCGTLRFDDMHTMHKIKDRKEFPKYFSNCVYIGDYCRTGVNAILMPGKKVGVYSIVGPGVILTEDVPDRTIISVSQTLTKKEWGPERYGW
jgi:NDP-sugar pyrophosphorylase family protein